jgi:twitching motility protein PilT
MKQMFDLLNLAIKNKASDLHLSAGLAPLIRVNGDIKKLALPILGDKESSEFCYSIMSLEQRKKYETDLELDFAFQAPSSSRFRVNVFRQHRGIAAVFRCIPSRILSLDELKAPPILKTLTTTPHGLILVTGPTGSGKSTSLAAMINDINMNQARHIITIEDPIEFIHESKKCLITQREIVRDTHSFKMALQAVLREDPDVILIGELRDLESIRLALTAAETGHLVLATLHTSSAARTIDRLIDVFPGDEKAIVRAMLAESLKAVISQLLIKPINVPVVEERIAAFEIMITTPAIRHMIREAKIAQLYSAIQTNRGLGMQTLDQHLQELLTKQCIGKNEAREISENKELFI